MFRKFISTGMALLLSLAVVPGPMVGSAQDTASGPQRYILVAGQWGAAQSAAIAAAGGELVFSHAETGVGIASSYAPDFLDRAKASNAFSSVGEDFVMELDLPVIPPGEVGPLPASVTPNDEPDFPLQWHLKAMEVPAAWSQGYSGKGVRVAILDGGIDSTHPDLAANIDFAASTSFVPGFQFNQDTGFLTVGVLFWHGTLVAGIVAAGDNGIGTIGVAPEATLIGVKVGDGLSVNFSGLLQGIYYAATTADADIINLSLGRGRIKQGADIAAQKTAIYRAITFAERQGALVVAAAGNSALDLDHSENFAELVLEAPGVIGVSATGPTGFFFGNTNFRDQAIYTNYGHSVISVAAPGGNINPSLPFPAVVFDFIRTTNTTHADPPGPGAIQPWFWNLGTSFAAPNVSGVAALVKQRYPNFNPAQLRHQLLMTADDEGKPGHDPIYGRGFVNARRAVTE